MPSLGHALCYTTNIRSTKNKPFYRHCKHFHSTSIPLLFASLSVHITLNKTMSTKRVSVIHWILYRTKPYQTQRMRLQVNPMSSLINSIKILSGFRHFKITSVDRCVWKEKKKKKDARTVLFYAVALNSISNAANTVVTIDTKRLLLDKNRCSTIIIDGRFNRAKIIIYLMTATNNAHV